MVIEAQALGAQTGGAVAGLAGPGRPCGPQGGASKALGAVAAQTGGTVAILGGPGHPGRPETGDAVAILGGPHYG